MKNLIYNNITVDVTNCCKYCGCQIDSHNNHCAHCQITDKQNEYDKVAEKALWSDNCFSSNFHTDFIYSPKRKELPYIKFQRIECNQFHRYKNLHGVTYLFEDSITYRYYHGYVDDNSKIVIPLIYETLGYFNETEIVPAQLNNKYGMIDIRNQIIVPFDYDYLGYFHDGFALYIQGAQRGYINIHGQKAINLPLSCCETNDFESGLAKIGMRINGECLYGFINHAGEFIIPPVYHSPSKYGEYYRVGKELAPNFLIDRRGFQILGYGTEQQIALPLDKYYIYGNKCGDFIEVARYKKATSPGERDTLLWGIINTDYQEIVPLEYEKSRIELIKGNYVLIKETNDDNYYYKHGNKYYYWSLVIGLLNGTRIPLPATCVHVEYLDEHQLFKIKTETFSIRSLAKYEDGTLKPIVSLALETIHPFLEKHAKFKQNHLWGILSLETGKIIVPPHYQEIIKLDNLIYVRQDKQYGVFSSNFNTDALSYIPCSEQDWENMRERKLLQRQSGDRKISVTWNWKRLFNMEELGWKYFKDNDMLGVIACNTMETIVPPCYDDIALYKNHNNRLLFVLSNIYKNSYGLMKSNGVLLTPCVRHNIDDDYINNWKTFYDEDLPF